VRRRLSLSRETLTDLTPADLAAVNAAAQAITPDCRTLLTFLTCDPTCFTE